MIAEMIIDAAAGSDLTKITRMGRDSASDSISAAAAASIQEAACSRLLPILPLAGDSICARGAPEAAGIESFGVAKGVAVEPEGEHLRDDANAQHQGAEC
jgi:hypothetical protein